MAEDPLSDHFAHPGPRRPIVVTPRVAIGAGGSVPGVVVLSEDEARHTYVGGWQPVDMLIGKVKPADPQPSIVESLSRMLA
jgi:hypothetical protein